MPWIIILFGAAIWVNIAYLTWRDSQRVEAEVQFITGIFTKISKKTRPRLYRSVFAFRVLFLLLLGASLLVVLAGKL